MRPAQGGAATVGAPTMAVRALVRRHVVPERSHGRLTRGVRFRCGEPMSDSDHSSEAGRRLLFAVTDARVMGVVAAGLAGLLFHSIVYGSPTEVAYPWNVPSSEPTEASVASEGVREAEPGGTEPRSVAEDAVAEVLVAEESGERMVATAPEPDATEAAAAAAEERAALQRALDAQAAQVRAAREAAARAEEERQEREEAARLARETARREQAPAAATQPTEPTAVDVRDLTVALAAAEAALDADRTRDAAVALRSADQALARVRNRLPSDSVARVRGRFASLSERLALTEFESEITAAIDRAGVAQEQGDYSTAIGLLRGLEASIGSAPMERREAMRGLYDLFRVPETVAELLKACEFERDFLGRTEPCERR